MRCDIKRCFIKDGDAVSVKTKDVEIFEVLTKKDLWKMFDKEQHKRRRCYIKSI